METTFYEDSRYSRGVKRPMTLDLNNSGSKKPRGNTLLTSPDLHMLKLESPELEKLIIQQHGGVPQPCMYPKPPQDDYARDFPDALGLPPPPPTSNFNLYQPQPDIMPPPSTMPDNNPYGYQQQQQGVGNPMPYAPPGGYYGVVSIKEEPQTVPCASPPRSPIDMEDQERLKLERKRLRNRIAASKCRRRKLERIARLEDKVAHLKNENQELSNHVTRLKEHVCQLKQQVMEHVRSGCEILVAPYQEL